MFRVYDGDLPARYPEVQVDPSWSNCDFPTFEEAKEYASKWLGIYGPFPDVFLAGDRYYYTGYGDFVIIREAQQENS